MSAVENVRQALDIVQVISEVVPLKKSGNHFFGVCPFHSEKTPSFSVSGQKQLFHCFGCKAGGDVFQFVKLYYRWDFSQALEELSRRAGIKLDNYRADPQWEEGFQLLEAATKIFEDCLHGKSGEDFRTYLLKARKIPERMWEEFRLGAHPGKVDFLYRALESKGFPCDLAVQLGLLSRTNRGDFIDRFQGRLIFPILDEKGRTRGFGGRTLLNEHPKYLNSPKTRHFDKGRLFYGIHLACHTIPRKGYAVLVEGYLDVISLHEFGVKNAIGSMGTALTIDQVRLLKRWSPRVISLYDLDQAGLSATEKNLGLFLKEGLESKVVNLPKSKDPDSFLHESGFTPEVAQDQLRQAFDRSEPAVDYLIEKILKEKEALTRGQKIRGLVQLLDQVPNEIERTIFKKDLAKRFDLPENLLFPKESTPSEVEVDPRKRLPLGIQQQAIQLPTQLGEEKTQKASGGTDEGRWEREILRFLVEWGEEKEFSLTDLAPYLSFSSKWAYPLLRILELQLDSKTIARLEKLEDHLESETVNQLREWSFASKKDDLGETDLDQVWKDLMGGLKRSYFKRESERLQREIQEAETNRDSERSRRLLSEKQDLIGMLRGLEAR